MRSLNVMIGLLRCSPVVATVEKKEHSELGGRERQTVKNMRKEGRDGKGEGINRKTRKNKRKKTEIKQF